MSNTDGEDSQPLLSNLAKLDKIPSKEVSGWHKKSNKRLGEQLLDAEKELASLREQLAKEHEAFRDGWLAMNKKVTEQEEVIRELIPIAEWGVPGFSQRLWNVTGDSSIVEMNKANAVIEKAKSLTTKDK